MDIYQITDTLFQSGELADDSWIRLGITVVFDLEGTLDKFVPGKDGWGIYLYCPIEDGPMPDPETVRILARLISALRKRGHKVLIHCKRGCNRSSLFTARSLICDGMTPMDAIALLRQQRGPCVLENTNFARWLMSEIPGT